MPRTIHDILPDETFFYWLYDPTPWKLIRNKIPCLEYTPPELPFGRQEKTFHILEAVDRRFYHAIVDGRRYRRSEAYFTSIFSQNLRAQSDNLYWNTVHFENVPPVHRNKRPRGQPLPCRDDYDVTSSDDDDSDSPDEDSFDGPANKYTKSVTENV